MVLPLVGALPYLGYGLLGASALFSAGTSLWSLHNQRQIYSREEDFAKRQSSDLNRWVSDYERNTGLKVKYPYLGMPGQARYMGDVRLPSFSNLYSQNSANMWGAGARGAFGSVLAGHYGYQKYRNSGYRVPGVKDISTHPEFM